MSCPLRRMVILWSALTASVIAILLIIRHCLNAIGLFGIAGTVALGLVALVCALGLSRGCVEVPVFPRDRPPHDDRWMPFQTAPASVCAWTSLGTLFAGYAAFACWFAYGIVSDPVDLGLLTCFLVALGIFAAMACSMMAAIISIARREPECSAPLLCTALAFPLALYSLRLVLVYAMLGSC